MLTPDQAAELSHLANAEVTVEDPSVAFYDGAKNDYDLSKDPRCLWGWGPPVCTCWFGHACFRPLGHEGLCWCAGDRPHPDDGPCHTHQRPDDWDSAGRAEANR